MLTPILLIAALALVQVAQLNPNEPLTQFSIIEFIVAALTLIGLTAYAASRLHKSPTGPLRRRLVERLDQISQYLALGIFAYWALGSSWLAQQSFTLICITPLVLIQIILWLLIARCVGAEKWSQRLAFVAMRLRFELVPIAVLILGIDLITLFFEAILVVDSVLVQEAIALVGVVVLLCILPVIMIKIWRCRPISDPDMRHLVEETCRESATPVRDIYVWPRRRFPFYNAMAMGLMRRLRIVIISEDLMHALTPLEIKAVIGHELGHLRYRHILLYLLLFIAMSTCSLLLVQASSYLWLDLVPHKYETATTLLLHLGLILIGIRTVFGVMSRACERQADLHGARLSSFAAMRSALQKVALLSGQDLDTPNWRHHSIAQRIGYLAQHQDNPTVHSTHNKYIMKLSTLIIIALLTALTISIWQNSQKVSLDQVRERDPDLNAAIDQALNNKNDNPLFLWLAEQAEFDRQIFVRAADHQTLGEKPDELSDKEQALRIYKNRYLYTPFLKISTGNPNIDLNIDNMLAYSLALGPEQQDDIEESKTFLKQLLPRLEKSVSKGKNPAVEDTIGCVHFALGDYDKAKTFFEKAKSNTDVISDTAKRSEFQRLLDKRIRACSEKAKDIPLE